MIIAVAWVVLMGLAVLGCLVADKWDWIDIWVEDWSDEDA